MNGLLDAIRADLLDRRMRLPAALVLLALLAALGYALLGGKGEAGGAASGGPAGPAAGGVPSLSQSTAGTSPERAVAETTYGRSHQHAGALVDPFKQLATPASSKTGTGSGKGGAGVNGHSSPGGSHGAGGAGGSGGSGSSGGSPTPPAPSPPPKPKPRTVYVVDVEFGKAPATGETPHLVPFDGIKVGQPVPAKSNRLAVLASANIDGKAFETGKANGSATFTLSADKAPIVSGPGKCVPSETQCESVKLKVGEGEDLQYLEPSGETVTYLLTLTGVFVHTTLAGK